MAFRFEELKVWHKAVDLSNDIDILSREFPKTEMYNLSSQIKRAADSVVLNIAEGSNGQAYLNSKDFLILHFDQQLRLLLVFFLQ